YRLPALAATGGGGLRDIQAEHSAIADAVLARDAAAAEALLRDHYLRTAATIRAQMAPDRQTA
ncbi:MAG: FCD domain-containing protein, partial [Paracoccaceae bacterium]